MSEMLPVISVYDWLTFVFDMGINIHIHFVYFCVIFERKPQLVLTTSIFSLSFCCDLKSLRPNVPSRVWWLQRRFLLPGFCNRQQVREDGQLQQRHLQEPQAARGLRTLGRWKGVYNQLRPSLSFSAMIGGGGTPTPRELFVYYLALTWAITRLWHGAHLLNGLYSTKN